ncbi:MAG: pseudouridine-5'-phosphate glycosidase [Ignavibacteria bacterium]|nr:pseudouridine-5'-phosphate glycosidase [Ignavibacteria bacterium]
MRRCNDTALLVENTVRKNNAVPATIAIIDGKGKVGLSLRDLEIISTGKEKF